MIKRPLICPGLDIGALQAARKFVLAVFVIAGFLLFALSGSSYSDDSVMRRVVEGGGILLIIVCIIGRTWSSFYIGGRKGVELVDIGPYSITRNPLYLFSIVGAAGVGAQVGSVAVALACALISYLVFSVVAQHEERLLLRKHRGEFVSYLRRVPRFMPSISLWHDEPRVMTYPRRVAMTFADALAFLLAIPLAHVCRSLQSTGALPVLISLP